MAEVTVDVAGRSYRMGCGEGEEEHLKNLARMIDGEAQTLLRQFGSMPEGRLLLMTALLIADRLADAEQQIAELGAKLREAEARANDSEREALLARQISTLAERIEEAAEAVGS